MKIRISMAALTARIRRAIHDFHMRQPKTEEWLRAHGRAIIADIDSMRKDGKAADTVEQFTCYRVEYAYKKGLEDGAKVARACLREAVR